MSQTFCPLDEAYPHLVHRIEPDQESFIEYADEPQYYVHAQTANAHPKYLHKAQSHFSDQQDSKIDDLTLQIQELTKVLQKQQQESNVTQAEIPVMSSASSSGSIALKKGILSALLGETMLDPATTTLLNWVLIVALILMALVILELIIKLVWMPFKMQAYAKNNK